MGVTTFVIHVPASRYPHTPHHDRAIYPTRTATRHSAVAYFTGETLDSLLTVDDFPELAALRDTIPPGKYTTARIARHRARPEGSGPPLFGPQDTKVPPSLTASGLAATTPTARLPLYTIDQQCDLAARHPHLAATGALHPHSPSDAPVHLPALKPPPWSPPRWPDEELRTRQPDLSCAQSQNVRRHPRIDLAPLIYLRKRPWPPRDVADDDVLQRFDCGVV